MQILLNFLEKKGPTHQLEDSGKLYENKCALTARNNIFKVIILSYPRHLRQNLLCMQIPIVKN